MAVISTDALTKRYGRARGIENVDLSVNHGDIFGFIGPNGAGKSTLIRTLLGLIRPSGGHAQVFGLDILKKKKEILRRIGYMPAEASYYPKMRARDVLRMSADLRRMDCSREAARLCERFDLDPSRQVAELSFGNRKKVSIVCALQHNPTLLILDEPTSGLDPLIQKAFWEVLKQRNAEGTTIFLSSHVLSEVQHHCRHAAIIREGRIIVSGTVEELSRSSARRVTLRGISELPPLPEGVLEVSHSSSEIALLYSGDMKQLMNALAPVPFTDITITEPELEEIFFHFYEKAGERI
ncbi:MAG: ABC transporter ATP-binding protein [Clostridiales bacterium]|nr:ABC transporter ATP-binding protein [Clostridiales bacterium]